MTDPVIEKMVDAAHKCNPAMIGPLIRDELNEIMLAARTALYLSLSEKYRLVPIEPTYEMIGSAVNVRDKAEHDLKNYVSGETTDWDSYMIAEAQYEAMLSTAPLTEGWPE